MGSDKHNHYLSQAGQDITISTSQEESGKKLVIAFAREEQAVSEACCEEWNIVMRHLLQNTGILPTVEASDKAYTLTIDIPSKKTFDFAFIAQEAVEKITDAEHALFEEKPAVKYQTPVHIKTSPSERNDLASEQQTQQFVAEERKSPRRPFRGAQLRMPKPNNANSFSRPHPPSDRRR